MSRLTVPRIGAAHGLQPHRVTPGKLAQDPACVGQLTAGVGLDRNPPDQAGVLGGDKKSRMQAWDRTQPGLPRKPGRGGTLTHDYKRHGLTTWCAAGHVLPGEVLGPGPAVLGSRNSRSSCGASTAHSRATSPCTSSWTTPRPLKHSGSSVRREALCDPPSDRVLKTTPRC